MKKIVSILLTMLVCLGGVSQTFAAPNACESKSELIETSHLSMLLDGRLKPVNEDPNSNINFNLVHQSKELKNDVELVSSKEIIRDVKKVDEREGVDTYEVTIIYNDRYKLDNDKNVSGKFGIPLSSLVGTKGDIRLLGTTDSTTSTYCDVKMSCQVTYTKTYVPGQTSDFMYKITKVQGGFVSKSDPQMGCKSMYLQFKAYGGRYVSPTSTRGTGPESRTGNTVNYPTMGSTYSLTTNSGYYYATEVSGTYTAGRTFFTVNRINSSFTANSYVEFGFGDITGIWPL